MNTNGHEGRRCRETLSPVRGIPVRVHSCPFVVHFALVLATTAAAQQTNLLRNPDFEQNLSCWAATGTAQHIEIANWHVRSPRWSFGIGNDSGLDSADAVLSQEVELPAPLPGAKPFEFTVWTMQEDHYEGQFSMRLEFLDPEGYVLRESSRLMPGGMKEKWRERTVIGVAPAGTKFVRVSCASAEMPSGAGRSFIWFDDAKLVPALP